MRSTINSRPAWSTTSSSNSERATQKARSFLINQKKKNLNYSADMPSILLKTVLFHPIFPVLISAFTWRQQLILRGTNDSHILWGITYIKTLSGGPTGKEKEISGNGKGTRKSRAGWVWSKYMAQTLSKCHKEIHYVWLTYANKKNSPRMVTHDFNPSTQNTVEGRFLGI